MTRDDNEEEFITKTKHRKKHAVKDDSKADGDGKGEKDAAATGDSISLRPRTMFAMKGRGRTESEGGSPYRPQWSKDGDGFVSATDNAGGKDADAGRRKSKVLRYTKEELLALHFHTKTPPKFPPDTVVASEHCLPPVSTLPFDYDEIYKQWALNRNRGRGRGRGANATSQPTTGSERPRGDEKWEENKWDRSKKDEAGGNEGDRWERGARPTETQGDDIWDDVGGNDGSNNSELDLFSMAEAAEKFRHEMDLFRKEMAGPAAEATMTTPKDDLDAFDQKLEMAAKAGQFEDSDEEAEWDMPDGKEKKDDGTFFSLGDPAAHPEDTHPPLNEKLATPAHASMNELNLAQMTLEVKDEWFYLDPQGLQQGPFKTAEMREWFEAGYFKPHLPIRFGSEGNFAPLAGHFVQGQLPFAAPPSPSPKAIEQRRLALLQQQEARRQQERQQMLLRHQQEQEHRQRLLQEEKMRIEMQRIEMARQHQQTQLYQQQMMHHHHQQQQQQQQQHHHHHQQQQQQQQHMLLQQQSSWQRSQREGIMSALGIFGGQDQQAPPNDLQMQFQSSFSAPQQTDANGRPFGSERQNQHGMWPQQAPAPNTLMTDLASRSELFQHNNAQRISDAAPKDPLQDSWGKKTETENRLSLSEIQNEEKRRAAEEVRQTMAQNETINRSTSPVPSAPQPSATPESTSPSAAKKDKSKVSPIKKNAHPAANVRTGEQSKPTGPWEDPNARSNGKSLREIQEEEQRQLRKQMEENAQSETSNLAQMGAQLKMMLGVDMAAPAQQSQPERPAPAQQQPAQPAVTKTTSAWNTSVTVQTTITTKKSMRDILEEEERLAQERAKRAENAPTNSHWMNVVAGTASTPPAVPKPIRSLGPVPASVLKSARQSRPSVTTDGAAAKKTSTTPSKTESDASFWNFGAAQAAKGGSSESATPAITNAFSSKAVSSELMAWCAKQLETIGGVENLTLMEYCASLEDPGEIREYLAAYLGSTPKVSAFATEFIQKKKQLVSGKKSSPTNTNAANKAMDASNKADTASKKSKRRTKGQKIDPSLLNYSVGS